MVSCLSKPAFRPSQVNILLIHSERFPLFNTIILLLYFLYAEHNYFFFLLREYIFFPFNKYTLCFLFIHSRPFSIFTTIPVLSLYFCWYTQTFFFHYIAFFLPHHIHPATCYSYFDHFLVSNIKSASSLRNIYLFFTHTNTFVLTVHLFVSLYAYYDIFFLFRPVFSF